MSGGYSYEGLSQQLINKVKNECKEDSKQVKNHLESFRRWISSMKHITCPTDDAFLLRFLRVAKYDHQKAEQRLDNFCTARRSPRGSSFWFPKDFPTTDPLVDEALNIKMQTLLGKVKDESYVVLVRPRFWDPEKIPLEKMGIVLFMGLDFITKHEEVQISGVTVIIDLEGVGRTQMKAWANRNLMKHWARSFQDAYPMRIKALIYYKEPTIFDVFFKLVTFFLNDKIKSKIHRVKDNITKLREKIGEGAEEILPNEYGGKAGSFEEVNNRFQNCFREYFSNGNPLDMINIDENQRPSFTLKFLKEYEDYKGELDFGETQGTFTKLSV